MVDINRNASDRNKRCDGEEDAGLPIYPLKREIFKHSSS